MGDILHFLSDLASMDIRLAIEGGKLCCYAPKGSLTPEISGEIARLKSEIICIMSAKSNSVPDFENTIIAEEEQVFPLSIGERSHYILQKLVLRGSVWVQLGVFG